MADPPLFHSLSSAQVDPEEVQRMVELSGFRDR
jgi:hypothetical protein